jgi:hypothetical protein
MDDRREFDDQDAEALLSGSGRGVDPQLADLFDDMRVAYTSQPPAVGAELAAVLAEAELTVAASSPRRFERMRSSFVAKAGTAAAALVAATGGLAIAHALPASMQDAAATIGIGTPAHHGHQADTVAVSSDDSSTTTSVSETTVPDDDNDQGVVVGTNQGDNNDDQGENECEAEEQGELDDTSTTVPCVTTTTEPVTGTTVPGSNEGDQGQNDQGDEPTTVATVPGVQSGNNNDQGTTGSGNAGDNEQGTPTTTAPAGGGSQSGPGNGDTQGG